MRAPETSTEPLTVTQVLDALEREIQFEFPSLSFLGEIAELSRPSSGHMYLRIKDETNQIRAVMWQSASRGLTFVPKLGDKVVCSGRPAIYKQKGELQISLTKMLPAGEGELRKKFLELKAKLEKEGYFAAARKRTLPLLPKAVGVVTSAGGAVVHDIEVRVRERFPQMKLYLVDARVQGEGAAKEVAEGVRILNESGQVDVIIVARGGGSLEDLWAFNEEIVVKAIFKSEIPVVSGVGHETDVTLADLVADVRAPTPTAAAEIVVPRRDDLLGAIDSLADQLFDLERWFYPVVQGVDDLNAKLFRSISFLIEAAKLRLSKTEAEVKRLRPEKIIELYKSRVSMLRERLAALGSARISEARNSLERSGQHLMKGASRIFDSKSRNLAILSGRLEALSPTRVLERGYSIIERKGRLVTDAGALSVDDFIDVRLAKGGLSAQVKELKRT